MIEQNIGLNMGRESCLREIEQIKAENANYIPTTEDKLSGSRHRLSAYFP